MGIQQCQKCGERGNKTCKFGYGINDYVVYLCRDCSVDDLVQETNIRSCSYRVVCKCCEGQTYRLVDLVVFDTCDTNVPLCEDCCGMEMILFPRYLNF